MRFDAQASFVRARCGPVRSGSITSTSGLKKMKKSTFALIAFGLLFSGASIGCGQSSAPTVVETTVPTEQDMEAYDAELEKTESVEY